MFPIRRDGQYLLFPLFTRIASTIKSRREREEDVLSIYYNTTPLKWLTVLGLIIMATCYSYDLMDKLYPFQKWEEGDSVANTLLHHSSQIVYSVRTFNYGEAQSLLFRLFSWVVCTRKFRSEKVGETGGDNVANTSTLYNYCHILL